MNNYNNYYQGKLYRGQHAGTQLEILSVNTNLLTCLLCTSKQPSMHMSQKICIRIMKEQIRIKGKGEMNFVIKLSIIHVHMQVKQ